MAEKITDKKEQIGFHKGAITTLSKERTELLKMVSVVEQLLQMHINGLKELGVDITSKENLEQKTAKK